MTVLHFSKVGQTVAFCRHGNEPLGFIKTENSLSDGKIIISIIEQVDWLVGWLVDWFAG
jgi:hypothetical protein